MKNELHRARRSWTLKAQLECLGSSEPRFSLATAAFNQMTRNSIVYFLSRGGGGLLTVATLAVFTRIMSPPEYGLYALGITVATIASSLLFQWLCVAVGRFYPVFLDRPGVLLAASVRG